MSNSSSSQRLIAIATVAIIGLLGLNGYLIYTKVNQEKLIKKQSTELIESQKLQSDLEKEYYQALADLDEMRSNNSELNSVIEGQKEELKKQKDRISSMIRTEGDLRKAREEISRLKVMAEGYVAEINKLQSENAALAESNTTLQQEKQVLTSEIEKERMTNDELVTARAALVSEKEKLEEENTELDAKVNLASVIRVQNILVEGYKLRNSGKEAIRNKAKSIDGLKICFNTLDNAVVSPGAEAFYVRLINPLGETLAIEDMGSGVMSSMEGNSDVRFTQMKQVDYANASTNECLNWQPNLPFQPGNYTVEIYNKGFLSGSSAFTLK